VQKNCKKHPGDFATEHDIATLVFKSPIAETKFYFTFKLFCVAERGFLGKSSFWGEKRKKRDS
jgi:hypothetical protein